MRNLKSSIRKSFSRIRIFSFVCALIVSFTNGHVQVFALNDKMNELGIDTAITYNKDYTNAIISVDMSNVDYKGYEITQVLGPSDEVLDLNTPSIRVSDNGEYILKISYIAKAMSEDKPMHQEAYTKDASAVSNKDMKEIKLTAYVRDIQNPVMQEKQLSIEDGSVTPKSLANVSTLDEQYSEIIASDLFDANAITVLSKSLKDTKNINARFENNLMIGYDAKKNGGLPTSNWVFNELIWRTNTLIPAKSVLPSRASWTATFRIEANLAFHDEDGQVDMGMLFTPTNGAAPYRMQLRSDYTNNKTDMNIKSAFEGQKSLILGDRNLMKKSIIVTLSSRYDVAENRIILTLDANGKQIKQSINQSVIGDFVNLSLFVTTSWQRYHLIAQHLYPVGQSSFELQSFQYTNYNPIFEDLKWFDSSNNEITTDSQVKPNDVLTIKAYVKNSVNTKDSIPAKLYLSDDQTLASTKGVKATDSLINGIPILLTNDIQEVVFTVVVEDTIGDISLGIRLEDDFFHNKIYKQVSSSISIGEIFANGTPTYTVMDYQRDAQGRVVINEKDEPTYRVAKNQNLLTQDSFVKVSGSLINPRKNEAMTVTLKTDSTSALGLAYDLLQDISLVNGVGTNLVDGFTFSLPSNQGEGSFSYIVPVKQNKNGTPFDTSKQSVDYTVHGSFEHINEGNVVGSWHKTDIISDENIMPIIDITTNLTTTNLMLEREEAFDLLQQNDPLLKFTGTDQALMDYSSLMFIHQGDQMEWNKFGFKSAVDYAGVVNEFVEDGTSIQSQVIYNHIILLYGNRHYTRLGIGANAPPRTKTGLINLTVQGGVLQPEAFFEIPTYVTLHDQAGIDSAYAGAKVIIGIKDAVPTTSIIFDVKGDTDFRIHNENQDFYTVSLYHEDKTKMENDGDKAIVGKFDHKNRKKVVWFNTLKDSNQTDTVYKGTMTFYITMKVGE